MDAWAEAACIGQPADRFFPDDGDRVAAAQAKAICRSCPVRIDCLDYAIDNRERYGIWGGLTTKERLAVAKRRRGRAA